MLLNSSHEFSILVPLSLDPLSQLDVAVTRRHKAIAVLVLVVQQLLKHTVPVIVDSFGSQGPDKTQGI